MKNLFKKTSVVALCAALMMGVLFTACQKEELYTLSQNDVKVDVPTDGLTVKMGQLIKIAVESVSDEGVSYQWFLDDQSIAKTKNLEYTINIAGEYKLTLEATMGQTKFSYDYKLFVDVLSKEDIKVDSPEDGFAVNIGQLLRASVECAGDEGVSFEWFLDDLSIAKTKNLEYMIEVAGEYKLTLEAVMGQTKYNYEYKVMVNFGEVAPPTEGATAYITKVLDYMPAVGQFVNKMPAYTIGDTQETMNKKVLNTIGNNKKGMVSLGGFGGYVTVGFDHTIENKVGKRDFRVIANAFYANANPDEDAPEGGSCEPGVIMVAYDINKNGVADDNEWYEIAGSSHEDPTKELWYKKAKDNGNNVNIYRNYEITYFRPATEPESQEAWETYIRWEDNQGGKGYKVKNMFHNQSYYPLWATGDKISFKGTCLPQNGIDESGEGNYFVLYKYRYGYADNETNTADESAIDISWAVNSKGQKVNLPGVDFIKIYTGVNQENGWLGECSTEITGIEDLHILKVNIDTRK